MRWNGSGKERRTSATPAMANNGGTAFSCFFLFFFILSFSVKSSNLIDEPTIRLSSSWLDAQNSEIRCGGEIFDVLAHPLSLWRVADLRCCLKINCSTFLYSQLHILRLRALALTLSLAHSTVVITVVYLLSFTHSLPRPPPATRVISLLPQAMGTILSCRILYWNVAVCIDLCLWKRALFWLVLLLSLPLPSSSLWFLLFFFIHFQSPIYPLS